MIERRNGEEYYLNPDRIQEIPIKNEKISLYNIQEKKLDTFELEFNLDINDDKNKAILNTKLQSNINDDFIIDRIESELFQNIFTLNLEDLCKEITDNLLARTIFKECECIKNAKNTIIELLKSDLDNYLVLNENDYMGLLNFDNKNIGIGKVNFTYDNSALRIKLTNKKEIMAPYDNFNIYILYEEKMLKIECTKDLLVEDLSFCEDKNKIDELQNLEHNKDNEEYLNNFIAEIRKVKKRPRIKDMDFLF